MTRIAMNCKKMQWFAMFWRVQIENYPVKRKVLNNEKRQILIWSWSHNSFSWLVTGEGSQLMTTYPGNGKLAPILTTSEMLKRKTSLAIPK